MKKRLGFVSNSSSSSFIVGPDLLEHIDDDKNKYIIHDYDSSYRMSLPHIKSILNEDMKAFMNLSEEEKKKALLQEAKNFLYGKLFYVEYYNHKCDFMSEEEVQKYKDSDYHEQNKIVEELATPISEEWYANNYVVLEYEDGTTQGCFFEHSVMPSINGVVKSISNH